MASRADEKAQLRAERVAREQADAAAKLRRQRFAIAGGLIVAAAVIAVVAIAISSHHGTPPGPGGATTPSPLSRAADARVSQLLRGIPQPSDNMLGDPNAPVSIIEYGDLECSVCDSFALSKSVDTSDGVPGSGVEDQIITNLVRTGAANLVYRSLETATADGVTPEEFVPQQVAADAAGMQEKGWNYIELFYNEQGQEGSHYVTSAYLDGLAEQIPGLNLAQWKRDLDSGALKRQVSQEVSEGTATDNRVDGDQGASTPTVMVSGKRGQRVVSLGVPSYAEVLAAVKAVE